LAISPATAYPGQIDATDPTGYPYGAPRNDVVIGDGQGTPLEKTWIKDLFGFEQALLSAAGLVPNAVPEKVGTSQYLDAIKSVSDARARLALQKSQAMNWPERAVTTYEGVPVNSPLCIAWAPDIGVAIEGKLFVAFSKALVVQTSEDGNLWTARSTIGSGAFDNPCVAYGKIGVTPGFLITYAGPLGCATSLDAISWSNVSATTPAHGVAAYSSSLSLWVIAGDSGALYTSTDTLTWTARTTPAGWIAGCGGVKRVVFANGLFVILPLASYNKVLTSPDGINWTERTLTGTLLWTGLAYSAADGMWMATNSNAGNCNVSSDGLTWTAPAGVNYTTGTDLAVNGSLWVMTTSNGNCGGIAWTTDKGASWTRGPAVGNHRIATAGWNRVLAADNRFIVGHHRGDVIEFALSQRTP
jgi:hypothetical protein